MGENMNRQEAIQTLEETGTLSTDLLGPLGIPFEAFLRHAQLPKEKAQSSLERLIAKLKQREIANLNIKVIAETIVPKTGVSSERETTIGELMAQELEGKTATEILNALAEHGELVHYGSVGKTVYKTIIYPKR